ETIYDYWDSNWMSGTSYDNLAPMVPTAVVASEGATQLEVNLSWAPSLDDPVAETPVQYYTIYRGTGTTGELAFLDNSAEPTYIDEVTSAGTYRYAVSATDFGGNESDKSEVEIHTITILGADGYAGIPDEYALKANYPNPFNPTTTIVYGLPDAGVVSLKIYDLTGKLIRTLVEEALPAGYHRAVWDGKDASGAPAATGVYFYRISAGDSFAKTRKMVLMK
ncbi:MAG: T9SS type A sorting domain-containing protein, partial [Fidelibacterota bacterium]